MKIHAHQLIRVKLLPEGLAILKNQRGMQLMVLDTLIDRYLAIHGRE